MKGIPSLQSRYNEAVKAVQKAREILQDWESTREDAATNYNVALNELQILRLLLDIQNGKVSVVNNITGAPVKISFV